MELKDRKYLNNTHSTDRLPGFAGGALPSANLAPAQTIIMPKNPVPSYNGSNLSSGINYTNFSMTPDSLIKYNQSKGWPAVQTAPKAPDKLVGNFNMTGSSSDNSASGGGPGFAIGAWLGGGVAEALRGRKSAEQLVQEAGTSQGSIGGVSYTKQNAIDVAQTMRDYDNATGMDFLTNPGRGITRLFMKGDQRREAERAALLAQRSDDVARSGALSAVLQQQNAERYNIDNGPIFAADGKLPTYKNGKNYNARVSSGEVMVENGKMVRLPGQPNMDDSLKTHVNPNTMIFTNGYIPGTKTRISDYVWETGDVDGGINAQVQRNANKYEFKNGKLPGFKEGGWGNFISSAIPALTSIGQIYEAASQKPYRPNIYHPNAYESQALSTLRNLRVNPYYMLPSIYGVYGKAFGSINRSGGLSAGQKAASRISAMNQTQKNVADMFTNTQMQNNQYLSNWASSALNAGQATAQRQMAEDQYANEYYAKSHAARQQGIQMGAYNLINQLQNYYANDFKRRQFNDTMDLYRSQNRLDWDRYYSQLNRLS